MIYKINNTILFRDDDGLIWIEEDEESRYNLTATTSRLLAFLLQKQGEVLTRELILTQVWDNYGLRSSNNSLNKYISDLRCILRNLGCEEEVILTLPRVGFKISENINITLITKPYIESIVTTEQKYQHSGIITTTPVKNREKYSFIIFLTIGSILIAFFLIKLASQFFSSGENKPVVQKTYSLAKLDGCKVITFKDVPAEMVKTVSHVTNDIITNNNIKCTINSIIYLQVAEPVLHGDSGRVFMAHCLLNSTSRTLSSCHNIYEVEYEVKS